MQHRAPQQPEGFTLLELLLVLLIMTAIVFLGINRYQLYKRDKDIAAANQNIEMLFQALNTYYYLNCKADQTFTVSLADLETAGLWNPTQIANTAIITQYAVTTQLLTTQTQLTQKPIYQLITTATLNVSPTAITWYQKILNATKIPENCANCLEWDRLPSYSIPSTSSGLWISDTGLRQFKEITTQQGDNSCGY